MQVGPSQQTRDVRPKLVQSWPTVCDAGPTLNQLCASVSCLRAYRLSGSCNCFGKVSKNRSRHDLPFSMIKSEVHSTTRNPANTGHPPNAVSMLGQRQKRWVNIETALGECPVFARKCRLIRYYFCLFVCLFVCILSTTS